MNPANGGAGREGTFRPCPESDEILASGFHEFLGDPYWDCDLKVTGAGDFYLYQWYSGVLPPPPDPKDMAELLANSTAKRMARGEGDCQSIVRTEQLSRTEAIQWILENCLPEQFKENVRIVCEDADL